MSKAKQQADNCQTQANNKLSAVLSKAVSDRSFKKKQQ